MAKRLTDRLSCNEIFIEEMHRQGLTVKAIVGEVKRGMTEAMHPQYTDQPDNFNRRYYTDMAIKLFGGYAPTKYDIKKDTREISFNFDLETLRRAEEATGEKFIEDEDLRNKDHLQKSW